MQPEINVFGLTIQSFGLCLGLAFLVAGWMVAKRLKELGRSPDFAYEMVFAALIGGIVGAKLWFLAENGGPLFSGTGLTFYGGLLGGALAVCAWAKYKGQLDLRARRRRRALAGRGVRDRPRRLPARRRRRLRLRLGRAVGDGLSQRHGADRHAGPPDADLRGDRHGRLRAAAVALARPLVAGHAERHLPDRHGPGALAGRVRAPQRRRRRSGSRSPSSSRWR